MKKLTLGFFTLLIGIFFSLSNPAQTLSKEDVQTKCPVLGGSINKRVYTDYQDYRIYFCCPPCIQEFKKNPEKYMKKFQDEGVVLEKKAS